MNLKKIDDLDVFGKKAFVRLDLDVGDNLDALDEDRLRVGTKTIRFLLDKKAKIILAGHRGRPDGKINGALSMVPVAKTLSKILQENIKTTTDIAGAEAHADAENLRGGEILMLENLRFDCREEENDEGFAKNLSSLADFYVNESFASSHRLHASIVGVPKFLPHAAGFRFINEVENLDKIIKKPRKPLVFVIGGVKRGKLDFIADLKKIADRILIGGKLPDYLDGDGRSVRSFDNREKTIFANLIMDKEDITIYSIEIFKKEIAKAKTIVLAGPMGKFEEEGHRQGTKEVFQAVASSNALKIAGGGDSESAIRLLEIENKFDWISVGGGAMLEFLSKRTLPGLEVLLQ